MIDHLGHGEAIDVVHGEEHHGVAPSIRPHRPHEEAERIVAPEIELERVHDGRRKGVGAAIDLGAGAGQIDEPEGALVATRNGGDGKLEADARIASAVSARFGG